MKAFILSLLNPQGTVSFGRFMSFVITAFVLGWDTSIVVHSHVLPTVSDLGGQIAFMSAFYGITKYGDLKMNAISNPPPQPPTPPTQP